MNAVPLPARRSTRLFRAATLTVFVALAVNLIIRQLATAIVDVPHRFSPLQPGPVTFLTIGGAAAAAAFGLLRTRTAHPVPLSGGSYPLR